jgi:tRNA modification GTPase
MSGEVPASGEPPRFGRFLDGDGRELDHGYVVVFPEGGSFTGDLTVELWPHGSPVVLTTLVDVAIAAGAEPASPGEFTYRALRSGRIDLARAEAVRDLVEARTTVQARVAFEQVEGALSRRLSPLSESLEEWISRGEAAVEFVDESETHLPAGALRDAIVDAEARCRELLAEFETGRVVREGATLVMVGAPNVGKSSLFNRLLARDRAIVTPVAGTTRDILEEELDLDGIPVRLIDTAGLRDVADEVESEGVRRARHAGQVADLVLIVLDGSRALQPEERERLTVAAGDAARTVVVVNKSDLTDEVGSIDPSPLRVSAMSGDGLDALRSELRSRLVGRGPLESPALTNARHAQALERAVASLGRSRTANDDGLSEELVLEDLRDARRHLGTITGDFDTEAMFDRIFSTFCIGK